MSRNTTNPDDRFQDEPSSSNVDESETGWSDEDDSEFMADVVKPRSKPAPRGGAGAAAAYNRRQSSGDFDNVDEEDDEDEDDDDYRRGGAGDFDGPPMGGGRYDDDEEDDDDDDVDNQYDRRRDSDDYGDPRDDAYRASNPTRSNQPPREHYRRNAYDDEQDDRPRSSGGGRRNDYDQDYYDDDDDDDNGPLQDEEEARQERNMAYGERHAFHPDNYYPEDHDHPPPPPVKTKKKRRKKGLTGWIAGSSPLVLLATCMSCFVLAFGGGILVGSAYFDDLIGGNDDDDDNLMANLTLEASASPTPTPTVSAAPSLSSLPTTTAMPSLVAAPSPVFVTFSPTLRPITIVISNPALFNLVSSVADDEGLALRTEGTPQFRAFMWMQDQDQLTRRLQVELEDDPRFTSSSWDGEPRPHRRLQLSSLTAIQRKLLQRYSVVTFYFSTNGDTQWIRKTDWLNPVVEECEWGDDSISFLRSKCGANNELLILEFVENEISGVLPPELGYIPTLEQLTIDNNPARPSLGGGIPATFRNLVKMEALKIIGNGMDMSLPDDMWNDWTIVTQINLSNNNIPGPIPSSVAALSTLTQLDLGNNRLSGPVPTAIAGLTSILQLDLSDNQLSQDLPAAEIAGLVTLQRVRLQNNGFTGPFPDFSGWTNLNGGLDVSNNQLSGPIPDAFDQVPNLRSLKSSNNLLRGGVPSTLISLTRLNTLDLSQNEGITGKVPDETCATIQAEGGTGLVDCVRVSCICCGCPSAS